MTTAPVTHWVIANWKLNPRFDDAKQLFQQTQQQLSALQGKSSSCQVAIAPPSPYLAYFSQQNTLTLAAQDLSIQSGYGAYTGETSAALLKSTHIEMVIIGHSERRELFGDDVARLQQKTRNALAEDLTVVYCVGESLAQREAGQAQAVVLAQIDELTAVVGDQWHKIIIAYEPIWAIGTGKTASADDAQAMHAAIRQRLTTYSPHAATISILYGGSVKPENAVELAACADINGALVGGASLNATHFAQIVQAFCV